MYSFGTYLIDMILKTAQCSISKTASANIIIFSFVHRKKSIEKCSKHILEETEGYHSLRTTVAYHTQLAIFAYRLSLMVTGSGITPASCCACPVSLYLLIFTSSSISSSRSFSLALLPILALSAVDLLKHSH